MPCQTLDIGKSGASVVTDIDPPLCTAFKSSLRLPAQSGHTAAFEAEAVVVNSILSPRDGGFRVGLNSSPLAPAALAAIKGHVPWPPAASVE